MMGADSVAYHQATVMGRADDFPGQALAYYASRGETPLEWGGSGVARLGLAGRVTREQYTAIYGPGGARHPRTGAQLAATRRPGMELVISAHKSVAELGVIGRAEDMHRIMDGERDTTLAYLEAVTMEREAGGAACGCRRPRVDWSTPTPATPPPGPVTPAPTTTCCWPTWWRCATTGAAGKRPTPPCGANTSTLPPPSAAWPAPGSRLNSVTPSRPIRARWAASATGGSPGSPTPCSTCIPSGLPRSPRPWRTGLFELLGTEHRRPGHPRGEAPDPGRGADAPLAPGTGRSGLVGARPGRRRRGGWPPGRGPCSALRMGDRPHCPGGARPGEPPLDGEGVHCL